MGKHKLKSNHSQCTKEAIFTLIGSVLALMVKKTIFSFVIDRILDAYLCGVVFLLMSAHSMPWIIILPTYLWLQQSYPWLSFFSSPAFFWDALSLTTFNPDCIFHFLPFNFSVFGLGSLLYLAGIRLASFQTSFIFFLAFYSVLCGFGVGLAVISWI